MRCTTPALRAAPTLGVGGTFEFHKPSYGLPAEPLEQIDRTNGTEAARLWDKLRDDREIVHSSCDGNCQVPFSKTRGQTSPHERGDPECTGYVLCSSHGDSSIACQRTPYEVRYANREHFAAPTAGRVG
jgi:hypothetical protein